MSQSLSSLFGGSSSSTEGSGGLFSDSAKQKFARVYKPEEFDLPVKKAPAPKDEDETNDLDPIDAKKKKRNVRGKWNPKLVLRVPKMMPTNRQSIHQTALL